MSPARIGRQLSTPPNPPVPYKNWPYSNPYPGAAPPHRPAPSGPKLLQYGPCQRAPAPLGRPRAVHVQTGPLTMPIGPSDDPHSMNNHSTLTLIAPLSWATSLPRPIPRIPPSSYVLGKSR